MIFDRQLPHYGDLYTVQDFTAECMGRAFIDYDGHGYPVKDTKMSPIVVKPHDVVKNTAVWREAVDHGMTHVMWFNK